jgi:hypothetical protein
MNKFGCAPALKKGLPILIFSLAIAIGSLLLSSVPGDHITSSKAAYGGQNTSYQYGAKTLVGATPDQIGQYAIEYAQHQLRATGELQVMLSRPIADEDRPVLGLGCPPSKTIIEDTPQSLVILKGDFDINGVMRGDAGGFPWHFKYVAYIFDDWSASDTAFVFSRNGGRFRLALNDLTLSSDNPDGDTLESMATCPTPLPYPRLLHYGEVAPPLDVSPTNIPPTEQAYTPSVVVPSPVATEFVK